MNIFIMADIEGISGIYTSDQVSEGAPRFMEGREYFTKEINVCAAACKKAGVEKVYVRDAHGGSYSILWDKLSSDVDYCISGFIGNRRFPYLDECDGVILLGYHAMAGTKGAILEHTMSSTSVQNYWINNTLVGEIAIDAGIVGDLGKSVIMVSGDDKVCMEAKKFLPDVVTCEVKHGMSRVGGILLSPERAYNQIYIKTIEAIEKMNSMKPLIFEKPINIRIELTERNMIPNETGKSYMKTIDGRTYEVQGDTVEEALFRL